MLQNGKRPENYINLISSFEMWSVTAHKHRRNHIERQKDTQSSHYKGILFKFYNDVYHREENWAEYDSLIAQIKASISSGKIIRISANDLVFATGLNMAVITANNFKRAGNLALLEGVSTIAAINKAYTDFKFRFPEESVKNASRRLNRGKCVPAVFYVENSTKKNAKEGFALFRARDQLCLLNYYKYVRRAAPADVITSKLFFNSHGDALNRNVHFFLEKLGEKVNFSVPLTFNVLRRAIETENMLGDKSILPGSSKAVSSHLGHSSQVAEEYYVREDDRHVAHDSYSTFLIFEGVGEGDEPEEQVDITEEELVKNLLVSFEFSIEKHFSCLASQTAVIKFHLFLPPGGII